MIEITIFLFAAFFAAVFATLAGFGSSTVLLPVAMNYMDIKTAVFLVACFHLFNNLFKVHLFFKNIDRKLFMCFGVPSILFAFLGALFISLVPSGILKNIVAVFLILFALYSWIKPDLKIHNSLQTSILGGGLSGFLAGLVGLGGAVRGMFLISFRLPKEVYIATSALIAFVVDLTRIPTYLISGVVKDHTYFNIIPILCLIAYVGVRLGKNLLNRIDQNLFQKIVLSALFIVGVMLLVN